MTYIVLAIIYLFFLNIVTTFRLLKSELYEKSQKVFQTILIWLLPLIGALFVSMLLNQHEAIELKNKNILKSILLFIFIVKIKKNKNNENRGYGETESPEDIYHASFQASASDL
jgi:hypothetical protein